MRATVRLSFSRGGLAKLARGIGRNSPGDAGRRAEGQPDRRAHRVPEPGGRADPAASESRSWRQGTATERRSLHTSAEPKIPVALLVDRVVRAVVRTARHRHGDGRLRLLGTFRARITHERELAGEGVLRVAGLPSFFGVGAPPEGPVGAAGARTSTSADCRRGRARRRRDQERARAAAGIGGRLHPGLRAVAADGLGTTSRGCSRPRPRARCRDRRGRRCRCGFGSARRLPVVMGRRKHLRSPDSRSADAATPSRRRCRRGQGAGRSHPLRLGHRDEPRFKW